MSTNMCLFYYVPKNDSTLHIQVSTNLLIALVMYVTRLFSCLEHCCRVTRVEPIAFYQPVWLFCEGPSGLVFKIVCTYITVRICDVPYTCRNLFLSLLLLIKYLQCKGIYLFFELTQTSDSNIFFIHCSHNYASRCFSFTFLLLNFTYAQDKWTTLMVQVCNLS